VFTQLVELVAFTNEIVNDDVLQLNLSCSSPQEDRNIENTKMDSRLALM
jgi:hypothetical protein